MTKFFIYAKGSPIDVCNFVFVFSRLNEADEEIGELKQVDPMLRRELEICMQVSSPNC